MSDLVHVAVVVGNPKPASRTLSAATYVAEQLSGAPPKTVIDLATVGPALLDWSDERVAGLVDEVSAAQLVVFACPTYKSSFTGLLKLFLDRFRVDSLTGVVAVPLMLGALPGHSLAPEAFLRPVLADLGATIPGKALFIVESAYDSPAAYAPWLSAVRPIVAGAVHEVGSVQR
jgi:FMN reductase